MKEIIIALVICSLFPYDLIAQGTSAPRQIAQPELIAFPKVPPEEINNKDAYTYYQTNVHVQQTVIAIQTVLGERGARYKSFEQSMQDLQKKEMLNSNLRADLDRLLALQSGADIKLVFTTNIEARGPLKKIRVSIDVQDVATGQGLGSVQGVSDEIATNDISGLCISAVNNCIDRVLSAVKAYWDMVPTNGKPVKIEITSETTDLSGDINDVYFTDAIDDLFKKTTVSFKSNLQTDKGMEYVVYISPEKYEQLGDFGRQIRTLLNDLVKPIKAQVKAEGSGLLRIKLP